MESGSTALYDAVIGSLTHLKKGHKDKRVLLVITDGDDDASRMSFEDTVKAAEESNATIYTIGVFSQDDLKNDKKMVRHSKKVLTELLRLPAENPISPRISTRSRPSANR